MILNSHSAQDYESRLQAAADAGQSVWILGHVLPGYSSFKIIMRHLTIGWDGSSALLNGPDLFLPDHRRDGILSLRVCINFFYD